MKILPIVNQNNYVNNNRQINKFNNSNSVESYNYKQLTGIPRSYISFGGGKSLFLDQTYLLLENKAEKDGESQIPPRVQVAILKELEMGNLNEKTLVDVHKQVYSKLLNIDDLSEIRESYPEFENVKNFEDVDFKDNKFIADVKSGNNKIFNNKEDLGLQIIKLYWGEGFSLSDIAQQAETKPSTIMSVMKSLNIARVTPYYGRLLKLSDKEYNERFTSEMAEKREIIQAQKRNEPYIPRKPLTKEQKQRISESLIEFYANNPERLSEMSERQKEFYKKHPEAALIFKFVMLKAWNMGSCGAVRRQLKSFLESNNIKLEKNEKEPGFEYLSRLQSSKMKMFWDMHPQEKKKFSKGVEAAWEKINNLPNINLIRNTADVSLFPKQFEEIIKKWAIEEKNKPNSVLKNIDISNIEFKLALQLFPFDLLQKTDEHKVINEFFKANKAYFKKFNDAIAFQIIGIDNYYRRNMSVVPELALKIRMLINKTMKKDIQIDVNKVISLYAELLSIVKESGSIDDYSKALNAYDMLYDVDFNTGIHAMLRL